MVARSVRGLPSGLVTSITGDIPVGSGNILTAAINDSGFAIIGGRENSVDPYVALVSPSGIATPPWCDNDCQKINKF